MLHHAVAEGLVEGGPEAVVEGVGDAEAPGEHPTQGALVGDQEDAQPFPRGAHGAGDAPGGGAEDGRLEGARGAPGAHVRAPLMVRFIRRGSIPPAPPARARRIVGGSEEHACAGGPD